MAAEEDQEANQAEQVGIAQLEVEDALAKETWAEQQWSIYEYCHCISATKAKYNP